MCVCHGYAHRDPFSLTSVPIQDPQVVVGISKQWIDINGLLEKLEGLLVLRATAHQRTADMQEHTCHPHTHLALNRVQHSKVVEGLHIPWAALESLVETLDTLIQLPCNLHGRQASTMVRMNTQNRHETHTHTGRKMYTPSQ